MKQAIIMDVQRYSIHDGPGVRTTVFFKGCHMNCLWCHNPESQNPAPELLFYPNQCVGCGACRDACRQGAATAQGVQVGLCAGCPDQAACAARCPSEALRLCGRQMTVEQVLEEVRADRAFYGGPEEPVSRRGGVTCSGGEPLLQEAFVAQLLSACREEGFGTCVDTTLNLPWERVEAVLPVTDLFLVDLKLMDDALARQYTGQDSRLVRENLQRLAELSKPVILRTPLVKGVNDTPEEAGAREAFLAGMGNILRHDLFAVTDHGAKKYQALGREDWLAGYLKTQRGKE